MWMFEKSNTTPITVHLQASWYIFTRRGECNDALARYCASLSRSLGMGVRQRLNFSKAPSMVG